MNIGEKLKKIRKSNNLNQSSIAQKMGITGQQWGKYERGEQIPGGKFFLKLTTLFNVDLNWLLNSKNDNSYLSSTLKKNLGLTSINTVSESSISYKSKDDFLYLPLLTQAGAAENGYLETSSESKQMYAFRKEFIKRISNGTSIEIISHLFLVRIKGDSMTPTLLNNEIVLVNSNYSQSFKNGGIYLIRDILDNSSLAKRAYKLENKLILHSDNLNYEEREITLNDAVTMETIIIGRIVWGGRYYL